MLRSSLGPSSTTDHCGAQSPLPPSACFASTEHREGYRHRQPSAEEKALSSRGSVRMRISSLEPSTHISPMLFMLPSLNWTDTTVLLLTLLSVNCVLLAGYPRTGSTKSLHYKLKASLPGAPYREGISMWRPQHFGLKGSVYGAYHSEQVLNGVNP